ARYVGRVFAGARGGDPPERGGRAPGHRGPARLLTPASWSRRAPALEGMRRGPFFVLGRQATSRRTSPDLETRNAVHRLAAPEIRHLDPDAVRTGLGPGEAKLQPQIYGLGIRGALQLEDVPRR